ncbi:MAG: serine hydrolase [Akkermansiaceae bacterium]|nr:serine hydrolase [Akkermansiaceae bacterium]
MLPRLIALLCSLLPVTANAQARESVIVVEAYSGKILVGTNSTVKRPVASLTKMATAIVAVDWATATGTDLGLFMLTAPQTVALVGGPNPMNLQPGDSLSLRDALYSALLGSDNLAALTIADNIGRQILAKRGKTGDPVALFVAEMNKLAQFCGMTQTKFVNPHGLERAGAQGVSTAADMARLGIVTMRRNAINFMVRQEDRRISVTGPAGERSFRVPNTNELIGEEGIVGIKTGTTSGAGACLATCMDKQPLVRTKRDGTKGATPRRLVVIVLDSPDRYGHTRTLLTQGWAAYDAWLANGSPVKDPKREILSLPRE